MDPQARIKTLQARIAQLTETEARQLRLFRMASHDLKSALNNARIAQGVLRAAASDSADFAGALDTIELMVDHMGELTSQYLDAMELQTGKLELKIKPVNLRDLLTNAQSQFRFTAAKKRISLQIGTAQGWAHADAQRLTQALGNLVSNAIKFSQPGGKVTLCAALQNGFGLVSVADDGPGIPPEERAQLFTEFGRLSVQPTADEPSSGLGLWIVKHLMRAQNGRVGADFPDSGGSRFWLTLPAYQPDCLPVQDQARVEMLDLFSTGEVAE